MVDYTKKECRSGWFRDSVLGDISFDNFKRKPGNPVYTGNEKDGYLWPVNLFLFKDPKNNFLYIFIGCYGLSYSPYGPCRLMRSKNNGNSWQDLGIVLKGSPDTFDGSGKESGGTPEGSIVCEKGVYHFIYDWATLDASRSGLAYAKSDSPEGPFERDSTPIHLNINQKEILSLYRRTYACGLVKRKSDWIILTSMDCCFGKEGCSWAFACMVSKKPDGPYSEPKLLLCPQSKYFFPVHIEFYPLFIHQRYIYAAFTSVALNRNYQVIFRSEIEKAHLPESWKIYQEGSVWHSEPVDNESHGLWGQSIAGYVDKKKKFMVGFPSKNSNNAGTINVAWRPWDKPYKDGGILSAPNGRAISFVKKSFQNFTLNAKIRSNKTIKIFWGYGGPLGANSLGSHATLHPLVLTNFILLESGEDGWRLLEINKEGKEILIGSGNYPSIPVDFSRPVFIRIIHSKESTGIIINKKKIWTGKVPFIEGNIGLLAEKGAIYYLDKFLISGKGKETSKFLLPGEGIRGAGNIKKIQGWGLIEDGNFKFGFGYLNGKKESMAKWNYLGKGFRLYSPVGAEFGKFDLFLDGEFLKTINLNRKKKSESRTIFELDVPYGYHAVVQVNRNGTMPCDTLEYAL